jgi:hypothetical protein
MNWKEDLKGIKELSREETVENGVRSVRFTYIKDGQESYYSWGGLANQKGPATLQEAIEDMAFDAVGTA